MGFKQQSTTAEEGQNNNNNTTLSHVDNGRHRFRHSTRKIGLFWTFCFVVIFCADTSFTYRLDDDDSNDISTNELLPPLASSYSSSNVNNQQSKNIKVFYQSGVSQNFISLLLRVQGFLSISTEHLSTSNRLNYRKKSKKVFTDLF